MEVQLNEPTKLVELDRKMAVCCRCFRYFDLLKVVLRSIYDEIGSQKIGGKSLLIKTGTMCRME